MVVESVVRVSSIASIGFCDTVDGLLFGEVKEFSSLEPVVSFSSGSSGEGPAGTASTLVTDSSSVSSFNPVAMSVGVGARCQRELNRHRHRLGLRSGSDFFLIVEVVVSISIDGSHLDVDRHSVDGG